MREESREVEVRGMDPWGLRRVEQLLQTVEGVNSLKLVPDERGGIDEIHVLSSSSLGAKQIVRNIESALLAQFGLQVDHRKISIAQVKDQGIPLAEVVAQAEEALGAPPAPRRLVIEGFQLERHAGESVVCRVELRSGENTYEGEATGPDYARSRLEIAGQAVLNALSKVADGKASFAIEGVTQIELFNRDLVIAMVQAFAGRRPINLPGIAEIRDSIEESVVYACLNAANRWIGNLPEPGE